MNIIFDIETKPQAQALEDLLETIPQFDPSTVAVGNLKDEEKIKLKIEDAKNKHITKMIEWKAKQLKACCLDSDYGQISAIGIYFAETGSYHIIDAENKEKECLIEFWSICESTIGKGYKAFGWNIEGFDLPFLMGRSRLLGINYDSRYLQNYRFFHESFVDLHKVWTFGQYGKFCKLEKAAKALKFKQPELPVSGATFWENWAGSEEERENAKKYLINDLDMTFAVAKATHGLTEPKIDEESEVFA